jgi:DNA repair exonuclease SbcCD nuclease subunit
MNLFKKAVTFTDIHFGRRNNSKTNNNDCLNFIRWMVVEAKKEGAETCIFMGDWHDTRHHLHVGTMNYSLEAFEILSKSFEKVYVITGNHDQFFKENRDWNSIEFARNHSNIIMVNDPQIISGVGLVPWLVGDEWMKIKNWECKYVFGHLELPGFLMNAMVSMPDHGGLNHLMFDKPEYVFSGHFHKRQRKGRVWYTGNCFPHNFSDAWDDDRGIMFLEWDSEPVFRTWPKQPIYRSLSLTELLENPDKTLNNRTHAKISVDRPLSYEEVAFLREALHNNYKVREISLVPAGKDNDEQTFDSEVTFQSVDQIVIEGLKSVESSVIETKILVELYNRL